MSEKYISYFKIKFATEEPLIVPSDEIPRCSEVVNKLFSAIDDCLSSGKANKLFKEDRIKEELLDDDHSPNSIDYKYYHRAQDFRCLYNLQMRQININEELKSVAAVKSGDKDITRKQGRKYQCYLWMPPRKIVEHRSGMPRLDKLLYTIILYKPFFDTIRTDLKMSQVIHILGTNTLNQLESLIRCNHKYCCLEDMSERVKEETEMGTPQELIASVYNASLFFIHNTFYINYLNSGKDSSKELREFLEKKDVGKFITRTTDCLLDDIQLQIGRPYVYQHLAECEHVFVVSDIKFLPRDDYAFHCFPQTSVISKETPRICTLCKLSFAKWLVKNYLKLTLHNAYLCQRCLLSYCYSDGRKLGNFQVYKYVDPIAIG